MFDSKRGGILERIMKGDCASGNFLAEEMVRIGLKPAVLISVKMVQQRGRREEDGKKQSRDNYRTSFLHHVKKQPLKFLHIYAEKPEQMQGMKSNDIRKR